MSYKSKLNHYYPLLFNSDYEMTICQSSLHSHVLQMDAQLEQEWDDGDKYIVPENYQHADPTPILSPKYFGKFK